MLLRVLHLLDATTTSEAVETLAILLRAEESETPASPPHPPILTHEIAVLGHRSTHRLLAAAGLADETIHWLPSLGWADPAGWRALRRLMRTCEPTHLHSWGVTAAVAAAMARSRAQQIVTLSTVPHTAPWMILRALDTGDWRGSGVTSSQTLAGETRWVGMTRAIARHLRARLASQTTASETMPRPVLHIPPVIDLEESTTPPALAAVREELGISTSQPFPVLLLGGDASGRARHDFGLWVGGILQQMYPDIRVIIREDPRGRRDVGLERLLDRLPDGEIPILAPAEFSWRQLLALSDVLLVSADGSVAMGGALHAMAAGIPVVGTPVESVQEIIENGRNGLIATEPKARSITAPVEEILRDTALRQTITRQARIDVAEKFSAPTAIAAYRSLYEGRPDVASL